LYATLLSFDIPAQHGGNHNEQLFHAARAGAARELFEETGLDVRTNIDRLQPVCLKSNSSSASSDLVNEYKHRLFFYCLVTDDDFSSDQGVTPIHTSNLSCQHLKVKISYEHAGFTFQHDPTEAAKMLQPHSGGTPSDVLLMALRKYGDSNAQQGSDNSHAYGFLVNINQA
jgi:ADP-ribose pyrophosphatase YjhB (NUDIX family)